LLAELSAAATGAVRCAGATEAVTTAERHEPLAAARAVSADPMPPRAVQRRIGAVLAAPAVLSNGETCRDTSPEHDQRYA
jgi:hypothetical protein